MFKKIAEFDNRVSVYWTNRHFSEKTTKILKFYVRLGDGYIWGVFALVLFLHIGWSAFWPILAQALVAVGVALALYEGVKLSTKRPRPFAVNPQIKAEVPPLDKYSFPSGQIYRIRTLYTQQGDDIEYDNISGAVAPGFRQYVPGVETATRWTFIFNSDRFTDEDKNVIEGETIVVDSCFFDVFDTEILAGNPKEAFSEVASAMVSESFAKKMGGVSECIGKVIFNEELPTLPITIKGVFKDFPHHSSIKNDVLISMETIVKQSTEN